MKTIARWLIAFVAVIVAFAVPVWLCGTLILRDALKDPAVRWAVAAAAGTAVAAFVALWAYGFVTEAGEDSAAGPGEPRRAGRVRNQIKTKDSLFIGPVLQGDTINYKDDAPPPEKTGQ